ncbi:MAG TPA: Ig-like domain-containing protein [Myxococcales bacterium]|nr:Ig-like domain-containing protein [Myxococcales bacterium]
MQRAAVVLAALGLGCSCASRRPSEGVPDADRSSLLLTPGLARADGSARIVVRVEVRDGGGAPVAGALVRLSASCPGIRFRQPEAADGQGILLAEARSTSPGRCRVTALLTAKGRTVLLDRAGDLVFAPSSRVPGVDVFPFGRGP